MGGLDENSVEKLNQQMLSEQQRIRDYAAQELSWAVSQYDVLTSIEQLLELLPDSLGGELAAVVNAAGSASSGSSASAPPSRPEEPAGSGSSGSGSSVPAAPDYVMEAFDAGGSLSGAALKAAVEEWGYVYGGVSFSGNSLHVSDAPWYDGAVDLGEYSSLRVAMDALHAAYPSHVPAFANGGVFTNSVVSKPTYFDMGLMGEAGDEAIVPLHMGPEGLGIKNYSQNSQKPQIVVQTDPVLIAELQQLRSEVAQLRAERAQSASKAEQQRTEQQRATESVARASKKPVGVI